MMTDAEPVRVAIIGCGQIGAMWDSPQSTAPALTHAAGFSRIPGAQLCAFCDTDLARAQQAAARWGVAHAYDDVAQMLQQQRPHIVTIAAATQARMRILQPLLGQGVRLLVLEKPLAATLEESQAVVHALQQAGQAALVNYSRNWDSALQTLFAHIRARRWGQIQRLQAWYGKGLSNNGSHMIDLVCQLLQAQVVRVRASCAPLPPEEAQWSAGAGQSADLALDCSLEYGDGAQQWRLDMLATDQRDFTCFELRIILQQAIIDISQGGRAISLRAVQDDPHYANYRIPGPAQEIAGSTLDAMQNMAQQAFDWVRGSSEKLACAPEQALQVAHTVHALKRSAATESGNWIAL
ncbi:Gfo/Idh/MocA family oxidoreductase [Massilia sp. W12]|uniref:Gfo/Idh/MocA family protein n=1 Tax=Massilia sp. W12 TaxID=3126507 RepID=UPI0030CBB6C3